MGTKYSVIERKIKGLWYVTWHIMFCITCYGYS